MGINKFEKMTEMAGYERRGVLSPYKKGDNLHDIRLLGE